MDNKKVAVVVTKELCDAHGFTNGDDCPLFHALRAAGQPVYKVGVGSWTGKVNGVWFHMKPLPRAFTHQDYFRVKETGEPWVVMMDRVTA